MIALKWIGWGVIGIGILSVLLAFASEEWLFLLTAVSGFISGAVFLALELIVTRLTEIRDAIRDKQADLPDLPDVPKQDVVVTNGTGPTKTTPSDIADLEKRIAAAKR
jgi:hypothetical protein